MTRCPRCRADHSHCYKEWQGVESGKLVWTVWHCMHCSFTWRDTEPARSIDYAVREAFSRIDPDRSEDYDQNIPPARARD
jgi:hypothetical protein